MALSLTDKKRIVAEVAEIAAKASSVVVADYRGLTVSQMTKLRLEAHKSGVYLRVVRNTLSKRALDGTEFDCIRDVLVGPLCLAFSQHEPSAAARLLRDFAKEYEKFQIIALSVSGKLLTANQIDVLANLPTREEAIAKLLFVLKAPLTKFVRTLAEPHAKLVRTVAAIGDKKKVA